MRSFTEVFREEAGPEGAMRFDRFVSLALYHPTAGYYAAERRRVGREEGTDFYTSSSFPLFGELIAAAAAELVGPDRAGEFTFVEIGVEPSGGILAGRMHPFAAARTVRWQETLELQGKCIVFSNELFDAQPFRRFRRNASGWRELWVRSAGEQLEEWERPPDLDDTLPAPLPLASPVDDSDYQLDAPTGAVAMARAIARQPWTGLFLAADYGKSWEELAHAVPQGTARAYRAHRQSNDLLAAPGEQDLTCHVCWDWIAAELATRGFAASKVTTQEAFFVQHASGLLRQILTHSASATDPRKRALSQLLHPALMGRKFQFLASSRGGAHGPHALSEVAI